MSNPTPTPKLITAEDLRKIDIMKPPVGVSPAINKAYRISIANGINDLIASKMKHSTCKLNTVNNPICIGDHADTNTSYIHYITTPIEEEVEECDHQTEWFQVDGKAHVIQVINNYCPKCGVALTEGKTNDK